MVVDGYEDMSLEKYYDYFRAHEKKKLSKSVIDELVLQ